MASGFTKKILQAAVCLSVLALFSAPAVAAPILGETQIDQIPGQGGNQTPGGQSTAVPETPAVTPSIISAKATVLEFTILPSATDPDVLETTIILQQGGDNRICVNHASQEIIVRSYEADADPFTPEISASIRGQDSGHIGELAGFNSEKLFIRPASPSDQFDALDERFVVGEFEGVFMPDEVECDEELSEGETVCIDEVIRSGDCALAQHASLERELRLMLALNALPIFATAAGTPFGQNTGPVFGVNPPVVPGGGLPSGPVGSAPVFTGGFGGSGGGGLITVPNVIGLPVLNAITVINGSGLTIGAITTSQGKSTGIFDGLFVSTAFAQSFPAGVSGESIVVDQSPVGGTQVAAGSAVAVVAQLNAIPVPEPSTFSIFALGLLLVFAMYWFLRVRPRRTVRHV